MNKINNVLFVINPKAGTKNKESIPEMIALVLNNTIQYKLIYWEKDQDIKSNIRQEIDQANYDVVVAVGGDGTVNVVASTLINSSIPLAIIPLGSGNGLARFLKIPLDIHKAIDLIKNGKLISIDSCTINTKNFFCTGGIGFDAHISKIFSQTKKRGFIGYAKLSLKEYFKYQSQEYQLNLDGKLITKKAFVITFANANQYGNNAIIAPHADISDGLIDVTIVRKFNFFSILKLMKRLFNGTIHKSNYIEIYKAKNIIVNRSKNGCAHYDGESGEMGKEIEVKNNPASIKIVVPEST